MGKSKNVSKTKQALSDLAEIAEYYGSESLDLEVRFLEAAEQAFARIARFPKKGAIREFFHPKLKGARLWPMPGFPKILIFYLLNDRGVQILRVLHTSRDLAALLTDLNES